MLYQARDHPWSVFVLAIVLTLCWTYRAVTPYETLSELIFGPPPPSTHQQGQQGQDTPENVFIRQAMAVEFPTPIDYAPLREICSRSQPTPFRPGLLFTCEGQHGGIGMVRNQILRCVRYAMSAGAALVVPSMALRNAKDITDIETATEVPLSYLFDRDAFVAHLREGCPAMRVYDRPEDLPAYAQRVRSPDDLDLVGDQFEPDHPPSGLRQPREWRSFFDAWLASQDLAIRPDRPVHVKLGQSFLEYPVLDDGPAFYREFGKVLSFRNDTRRLAAKVLWELDRRHALAIDPARAVTPGAYYGAHLRLEQDAVWAWPPEEWRFSRTEEQFAAQFGNIARTGLNVVYVASGDMGVVEQFAAGLRANLSSSSNVGGGGGRNVTVVTKHDLLSGDDRARLDAMTFDQQALVDFMVMIKASAFMGVAHSSFPWNVALRRHEMSRYANFANEGSDLLRDEYSIIMGMAADYPHVDPFVTGIWP